MRVDLKTIRERKLVQWALGYLGACFLLLQLFDVAAEPLGWSGTALILLVTAMAVGFAVVLVLAWFHGEKGRQRASGPELLIIAALLAMGGLALTLVRGSALRNVDAGPGATPAAFLPTAGPTLAVLPFEDLSGDPDQEYLAAGFTEILTSSVAGIQGLRVISRTSVLQLGDRPLPLPEVARLLGADLVIEGSVLRVEDRVRITAQLIRGATDHHLWADSYEGDLVDAFTLIADVARRVAAELEVVLTPEDEVRLAAAPTPSAQAMEGVLRARYRMEQSTSESLMDAVRLLEQVLDLDPGFAPAWGVLAQAHLLRASWFGGGEDPAEVIPLADRAARRAMALDPGNVEAQLALAILQRGDFRWPEAEAGYRRVLDREPSRLDAGIQLVNLLTAMGRYEEAEAGARALVARAPLVPGPLNELVNVLSDARGSGRQDEILDLLERALAMDRQHVVTRSLLVFMLAGARRCDAPGHQGLLGLGVGGATTEADRLVTDICPDLPICLFAAAYTCSACGRPDLVLERVHALEQRAETDYVSPAYLAMFRLLADDREGAIEALERGLADRDPGMQWVANGIWYEGLWGDPEFEAIVDRVGIQRARPSVEERSWHRVPLTLSTRPRRDAPSRTLPTPPV